MKIRNIVERLFIILSIIFYTNCLYSQVTIGSNIPPIQGSLLDLKENNNKGANSQKGLGLPRVALRSQSDLYPIINNATEEKKNAHIGLLVYNVTDNVYHCPGLQMWDGKRWINLSQEKELSALFAPNSYIITPGQSVNIPVRKAYAAWYKYAQQCKGGKLQGTVSAEVHWQDTEGLITNTFGSEFSLPISGVGENAEIIVKADDTNRKGNAVIAVRVGPNGNKNDSIRWSWHIWVTDVPTTYSYDNNGDGVNDVTFMDRNLGATSIEASDGVKTFGLLYQWGRKDPFPSSSTITSAREPILYGNTTSITKLQVSKTNNLLTTVVNPLNYYYGNSTNGQDWYSTANIHNDELWNNFDSQKSPFDPCPEGWRVPIRINNFSPWNDFSTTNFTATTISTTLARGRIRGSDFYPNGGFRYQSTGGLQNTGSNGQYWTAIPSAVGALAMYIGNVATGINSFTAETFASRARGGSIRCVKE